MTRFMLLTGAAALAAGPALADMHMSGEKTDLSGLTGAANIENMIRSSEIVGGDIYAVDRAYGDDEWNVAMFEEVDDAWEDVGTIADIVFTRDGRTAGLVVSAGGFLDIGDSTVVLSMDDVRRVATDDGEVDYVVRMTADQLEALPEIEENWW